MSLLFSIYLFASEVKSLRLSSYSQSTTKCAISFIHSIQISYARNQQPLHSITINLCSRWPHYEQPRFHSSLTWLPVSNPLGQYENFFYYFIFLSWVEGLLVSVCCPSLYVTLRILRVSHALKGSAKQTLFPFCGLLTGFLTQRSLEQTLSPFH